MTVIQQLFNELEQMHPSLFDIHTAKGREFVNHFQKYIELERKQTIDAYEHDNTSYYPKIERSIKANEYYNDKYGK